MRDGRIFAALEPLQVRDIKGDHFTLGEKQPTDLSTMDVVQLRQDPPFDMNYITTTHILERVHPKTLVVNDPAWVRNSPEKIFVTEFPDLMPETPYDTESVEPLLSGSGRVTFQIDVRHAAISRPRNRSGSGNVRGNACASAYPPATATTST